MSVSLVPFVSGALWTNQARGLTGEDRCPEHSWCIQVPIRPFFWFMMHKVAESAVSSVDRGADCGSNFPFLENPTHPTVNCMAWVTQQSCVPALTNQVWCIRLPSGGSDV